MNQSQRVESLDCFRGLVIALMMFVNCAGGDPAFASWIGHRGWNGGRQGVGLADFVFPLFIFIMGVGAWFTVKGARAKGRPSSEILRQTFVRAVWLYLCGILLKCVGIGFDQAITWRIILQWDILQMLAWCGLVTKVFLLMPQWFGRALIVVAIAWKWFLLGSMTPGGSAEHVWTPEFNAQKHIIGKFGWIGVALTQGAGACALCMIGSEVARYLFASEHSIGTARKLVIFGTSVSAIAIWWSTIPLPAGMPLSKDFFTASYIVLNAGIGTILLCLMWYTIDLRRLAKFEHLCVLGKHALTVYMTAEFVWRVALMRLKIRSPDGEDLTLLSGIKSYLAVISNPTIASWITVMLYVALWFGFARYRENRRIRANNHT